MHNPGIPSIPGNPRYDFIAGKPFQSYTSNMRNLCMIRIPLLFLLLTIPNTIGSSIPDTITDRWNFLSGNPEFVEFMASVLDAEPVEDSIAKHGIFVSSLQAGSWVEQDMDLAHIKANLVLARHCTEITPKRKDLAKELLKEAETLMATPSVSSAYAGQTMVLKGTIESLWYLVSGSLSRGLRTARIIDQAYDAYPDELGVLLLKADRLLYSPGYGGGDVRKGVEYFFRAWTYAQTHTVNRWDMFTICSGLGSGLAKLKDERAFSFIVQAKSLYTGDPVVNELYQTFQEKD